MNTTRPLLTPTARGGAEAFILGARRRGVVIWTEGGELRWSASGGALDPVDHWLLARCRGPIAAAAPAADANLDGPPFVTWTMLADRRPLLADLERELRHLRRRFGRRAGTCSESWWHGGEDHPALSRLLTVLVGPSARRTDDPLLLSRRAHDRARTRLRSVLPECRHEGACRPRQRYGADLGREVEAIAGRLGIVLARPEPAAPVRAE